MNDQETQNRDEVIRQLQEAYEKFGMYPDENKVIECALSTLYHVMKSGRCHLLDWELIEQALEPEACTDFRVTVDMVLKECSEYCLKMNIKPDILH